MHKNGAGLNVTSPAFFYALKNTYFKVLCCFSEFLIFVIREIINL